MAQQTINIGASPNDGTGTPLRTAFQYTNSNFSELYTAVGPSGNNIVVPGNATITGDLTVDTSTLKVDSSNNRVGINTASPTAGMALDIVSATSNNFVRFTDGVNATGYLGVRAANGAAYLHANNNIVSLSCSTSNTTPTEQLRITNPGVFEFLDGAGGTRMTLNATGLGVGGSPSYKLDIAGSGRFTNNIYVPSSVTYKVGPLSATWAGLRFDSANAMFLDSDTSISFRVNGGASFLTAATIDTSGNVGIGVTPSAWQSSIYKVLELSRGVSLSGQTDSASMELTCNAYIDSGFLWTYKTTAAATHYRQFSGQHQWWNAPSGTAGTAITFTQAMTLDASGNLILLSSNTPATLTTNGQLTVNATSNTNLRFSYRGSDGVTRVANITLA